MSWYDMEVRASNLWEGMETPKQSPAKIFLDLYALQDMSPEARLEKAEKLDAVFAKIKQDWKEQGFANDEI